VTVTGATPGRIALAAEVKRLRDDEGLVYREIKERLGISHSYAQSLYSDPDGTRQRERRDSYQGTCERCGGITKSDGTSRPSRNCAACAEIIQHEQRYWDAEKIVARFREFYETTGRVPTTIDSMGQTSPSITRRLSVARLAEIDSIPQEVRLPIPWVVAREFGGWKNAVRAAGLKPSGTGAPTHRQRKRGKHMPREFIVLQRNGVGWLRKEVVEAITPAHAIEQIASSEGEFVAIPSQHWQEKTVAPKTVFAVVETTSPALPEASPATPIPPPCCTTRQAQP
jgi:hypothetical protein